MHPIVPIIMALGSISFLIGSFILARLGIQRIKVVNIFGKAYVLWRFTLATIGAGVFLIMISVLIHQNVPYTPVTETSQSQIVSPGKSDYELGLILSSIESHLIDGYISQFRKEYHEALNRGDKNTTGLLLLELKHNLATELEKNGLEPAQVQKKTDDIMSLLQPQQKK